MRENQPTEKSRVLATLYSHYIQAIFRRMNRPSKMAGFYKKDLNAFAHPSRSRNCTRLIPWHWQEIYKYRWKQNKFWFDECYNFFLIFSRVKLRRDLFWTLSRLNTKLHLRNTFRISMKGRGGKGGDHHKTKGFKAEVHRMINICHSRHIVRVVLSKAWQML